MLKLQEKPLEAFYTGDVWDVHFPASSPKNRGCWWYRCCTNYIDTENNTAANKNSTFLMNDDTCATAVEIQSLKYPCLRFASDAKMSSSHKRVNYVSLPSVIIILQFFFVFFVKRAFNEFENHWSKLRCWGGKYCFDWCRSIAFSGKPRKHLTEAKLQFEQLFYLETSARGKGWRYPVHACWAGSASATTIISHRLISTKRHLQFIFSGSSSYSYGNAMLIKRCDRNWH